MTGIFDSGAGGLSVFREIRKVLPQESYIYYADNAHCPYGDKPVEFVIERARVITELLIREGAQIIVVACNTATAAAIGSFRHGFATIACQSFCSIEDCFRWVNIAIHFLIPNTANKNWKKVLRYKIRNKIDTNRKYNRKILFHIFIFFIFVAPFKQI